MKETDSDTWFNALGNPYRRKILRLLSFYGPMYPQELARRLKITPRAVIKHLEYLKEEGIVTKEKMKRDSGGRDIHYYRFPWNAFFAFDLSSPSCFRMKKISREKTTPHRWKKRQKVINFGEIQEKFSEEATKMIQAELKELWKYHKEIQQLDNKRLKLMAERENQFKSFEEHFRDKQLANLVLILYRGLLDRFGTDNNWSHKDVMDIANVDYEPAYELIRILEEDLRVAAFNEIGDPRNPTWRLKDLEETIDPIYS
ncbi:MAG: ArsR/SmtB family transcription factor [Candidatus Odinarchaeota archaeon]